MRPWEGLGEVRSSDIRLGEEALIARAQWISRLGTDQCLGEGLSVAESRDALGA